MFSVLMCILAVEQVEKLFINKSWKYMIFSIIYMIIATCSYQGTVGIFVAISLIYILKYSNTIKQFIANNTKVALIYGIPAIFNFMLVRFLGYNSRVEGKIVLLESIKKIILGIKNLFINTYNIMPQNIFMIFILGIIVFSIYKIIITQKQKVLKLLSIFYILAGTLIATIAPQILQNTESIWFVARSSYPMAGVIGILLIYIFSNFEVKKIEQNIIIIFCLMFMCIQLSCFMKLSIDGYITNYQDKQESMKIINKINEYEEQTGIIVAINKSFVGSILYNNNILLNIIL